MLTWPAGMKVFVCTRPTDMRCGFDTLAAQVTRFLELYKNDPRYREIMKGWLRRLPVYRAPIEAALAREGLPTGLVFVAMIESGFTSSALSSKGAGGFWQFLAGIGRG